MDFTVRPVTSAQWPYWSFDDSSEEGRRLLREHDLEGTPLPLVLALDGAVLVEPSHEDLLATLGLPAVLGTRACDVAIIGAGPAGLAAAVYAASEGLATVVLEPEMPGGQAGTSSLIRNYLGFPHGLSGYDLTMRAVNQAWLFGASFMLGAADGLTADGAAHVVHAGSGQVEACAVVIATGVTWRRLCVPELEALVGAGVFYGAAAAEPQAVGEGAIAIQLVHEYLRAEQG